MVQAGDIRAGGVYFEITADDLPMVRRLAASEGRLRQWVARQNQEMALTKGTEGRMMAEGGGGFFAGGLRSQELFGTALKLGSAIAAIRGTLGSVKIISAAFQGDMEGARKATEAMPFGLGAIAKELSGPVDAAAKAVVFRLLRIKGEVENVSAAWRKEMDESVKQLNRGNAAIQAAETALKKATMTAREYAAAEVAGMNLSAEAAAELLKLKLQLLDADETKKRFEKSVENQARGQGLVNDAMDEFAKLIMPASEYLEMEVRLLGLSADNAQSLLNWKRAVLDVSEKQAAAEKRARAAASFEEALRGLQDRAREATGAVDALGLEQEKAIAAQQAADDAAGISLGESLARTQKLKDAYAEIRRVRGEAADEEKRAAAEEELRRAAERAEAVRPTMSVAGTFSAMAQQIFGGRGGAAERTAKAAEKTAQNTEEIKRRLERGIGVQQTIGA